MVVRYSNKAEKSLDMDDAPIDADLAVPSKRRYGNIQSHGHENCGAYNLKEIQQRIAPDMFDKPSADADIDFVQYLTGEMMSIMTDVNHEDVNDNAMDFDPQYKIFWDSLKEDGKSYLLEVSAKNGLSEPLKYEAKDESSDEQEKDAWRKKSNTIGGNVGDDGTNSSNHEDNSLVFKTKDALPVAYEAESHLIKGSPKPPEHSRQSYTCLEGDDSCQYLGSPSRERNSLFREQLMRVLRKPYDEKEHQILLEDIQARKPVERHMELRFGREQSYGVNKDGKSYLDHYYDLKRKLEAAKTSCKKLILLRGFFFWLQNLTQEGAFKPWQDDSCLAV